MVKRILVAVVCVPLIFVVFFLCPPIVLPIALCLLSVVAVHEVLWSTGFVKDPRISALSLLLAGVIPFWVYIGEGERSALMGIFLYFLLVFVVAISSHYTVTVEKMGGGFFFSMLIPYFLSTFIRLNGMTVGAVANGETELTARGAQKAADLVNFCDAFNIPVLTITNVKGYKASLCSERSLAKAVARLTYAFANATVPKVNVIAGEAFGSAYVTMNSKGIGADLVFAWKNAKIGMMDAGMAAKVMYADADAETQNEKAKEYAALQDSVEAAARRGYVDAVIDAADTRKQVIGAFEMLFTKRESRPDKKHGTV